MDKNETTQLISNMIDANAKKAQYDVTRIPYHIHNNLDAPQIPFIGLSDTPYTYSGQAGKTLIVNPLGTGLIFAKASSGYPGYVNAAGTAGTPFPAGWSVTSTGTGAYTVTHNLGTTNYTVVLTAAGATFHVCAIYSINSNNFTCSLSTIVGASLQNGDFTFILLPA